MSVYSAIMAFNPVDRAIILDACQAYSDHELDKMYAQELDDIYEPISVCGFEGYQPSRALAALDPVAYRCGFADWISGNDAFVEVDGETYLVETIESELEQFELERGDK